MVNVFQGTCVWSVYLFGQCLGNFVTKFAYNSILIDFIYHLVCFVFSPTFSRCRPLVLFSYSNMNSSSVCNHVCLDVCYFFAVAIFGPFSAYTHFFPKCQPTFHSEMIFLFGAQKRRDMEVKTGLTPPCF